MTTSPLRTYTTHPLYGGSLIASLPTDFLDASTIRQIPDTQEVFLSRNSTTTSTTSSNGPSAGGISLIIDLTERAAPPEHPCTTDEEALRYHFADYLESGVVNAAGHARRTAIGTDIVNTSTGKGIGLEIEGEKKMSGTRILRVTSASTPGLGDACSAALSLVAVDEDDNEQSTLLLFSLLRLPKVMTDVLVATNVSLPAHIASSAASSSSNDARQNGAVEDRAATLQSLLETPAARDALNIHDHVLSSLTVAEGGWSLFGE